MKKPVLLITGATGFIGQSLLRQLGTGSHWNVVALASRQIENCETFADHRGADGLYHFTRDDFSAAGIELVEAVVHLGAFTPKSGAEANYVAGCLANILNTRHLLENLPQPPRRFVFASSLDVYAPYPASLTEDACCDPRTLYGQSKLFCERMLAASVDPRTILQILRIGHIYGPGESEYRKFIPETIRRVLAGEAPRLMTTGEERRAFLNVADCCRMILAALELDEAAGPINIASRASCRLIEIARMLCQAANDLGISVPPPAVAPDAPSGRDVIPNATKMEDLLGHEQVELAAGLSEELEHARRSWR